LFLTVQGGCLGVLKKFEGDRQSMGIGFRVGKVLRITPATFDKNRRTLEVHDVGEIDGKRFVLPVPEARIVDSARAKAVAPQWFRRP
jgi:hypothetical protein